jgi:peptidoglycan/xylan/chitin deacetylase (PgdA/CDA1 family)
MGVLKGRRWPVWALGGLLVLALLVVAGWRVMRARCFTLTGDIVCRVETDVRMVALTFDDGPTPLGLDASLPLLDRYGARATYFLIGRQVEKAPDLVARIVAGGHEVANHSYSHRRLVLRSAATYDEEIQRTNALLERAGAPPPRLFRPPYGSKLYGLPAAVERHGLLMVMIDVEEPLGEEDGAGYAQALLRQVRPGSIILMHLMYRTNPVAREALPLVLEGLRARGYRVVSVSELLAQAR